MDTIEILRTASKLVYENVKDLAGTKEAVAGNFGRGAGGDISQNIDIIAEKTVLDYLKEINFDCVVLGEECGRVELSPNPKGFVIMDAIDGSANAVRGVPFFCCSLAFATNEKLSSITDAAISNLSTGDVYWASKGKGAFLNDKSIFVHDEKPIYKVVGINSSVFIDLRKKIRIQDMAAGYLLIKEAGGLMLDENLQPLDSDLNYETRLSFVAAASKEIIDEVFSLTK